ncbi:MAG: hypothetical protein HYV51_02580 [Parcubacteria group bacterium]|nr:hypothetical protein [Parcubacteria group bacterium]
MSDKRYAIMFLRFGVLASVVFAVFWGVWHLSGHQVPSYTSLKVTDNILWTFSVSRWWDIPFAFLVVNVYAWILRIYYQIGLKFAEKNDIYFSLFVGLIVGLGVGLAAGLGVGLIVGLIDGLIVGLIVGLGVGLAAGLGVGLGVCLGVGLAAGLGVGLGAGLIVGLGVGLSFLIKSVFSFNFWKPVCNWFTAKNIS